MPKNKKRRVRWQFVCILLILCISTVGLVFFQIFRGMEERREQERIAYLQQQTADQKNRIENIISRRDEFIQNINAINIPEGIQAGDFEYIKNLALREADACKDLLDQYDPDQEWVEPSFYNEVLALGAFDNKYSDLLKVIHLIDPDYITRLMEDWDRYDFTMAYLNQDMYQNPPEFLSESLEEVPLIIQWDLNWGYVPYGNLNIALAGCAPTCISMIYSYLLQDSSITPAAVSRVAENLGMYIIGSGSSHDIFNATADYYGIHCQSLDVNELSINAALEMGQPVVLNMVPGIFTHVGHFIVVTDIKDGQWVVNDPNSLQRSSVLWDPATVLSECRKAWSFERT